MSHDLFPDLPRNKTRLDVWKELHGAITHCAGFPKPSPTNWAATTRAILDSYAGGYGVKKGDDFPTVCAHVQRLLAEAEQIGYGATEEDACFALAQYQRMPWLESITLP